MGIRIVRRSSGVCAIAAINDRLGVQNFSAFPVIICKRSRGVPGVDRQIGISRIIEDYACCRTLTDEINEYNAIEVIYKNGNIRRFSNGREEMAMIRTYHDKGIDTTAWEMLLTGEQG